MLAVLVKNVMKGLVENVIEVAVKFLLQCRKLEVFQQVVLGLFGRMVRHLKNTARVQMANTLGGQDVVIGNLLKKGVFMEELKDQVMKWN